MISVVGLPMDGPAVELSFRRPPLSERSGAPVLIGLPGVVGEQVHRRMAAQGGGQYHLAPAA